MGQKFSLGFSDSLVSELSGATFYQLHFDAKTIVNAYEKLKPLAERLGVSAPKPRLAGFAYPHIASLGAKIVFLENSEPNAEPLITSVDDIDKLAEPEDYLSAQLIQQRLATLKELKQYVPTASNSIGHYYEGPITTAVLLMGQNFFMLPYDSPDKAHKLLEFCVHSAVNYTKSISKYFNTEIKPGRKSIPDDFAGMFPPKMFDEFVIPYWEKMYQGLMATERFLHSELLRTEHLAYLGKAKIDIFDPGADQYLTSEIVKTNCQCKFTARLQVWDIQQLSVDELKMQYKNIASCNPVSISFSLNRLADEYKIKQLLEFAREMEK